MTRFGRFEFGKTEPAEIYEGDSIRQERGYVMVYKGGRNLTEVARLVGTIHLGKDQSEREID